MTRDNHHQNQNGYQTLTPDGGYLPFFSPGQTIGLTQVAERELAPTDLAVPPGETDRQFITDQRGSIFVTDANGVQDQQFLDLTDQIPKLKDGHEERGLLGLAFHPEFETNRKFYVRYSADRREGTPENYDHTFVLAEFKAAEDLTHAVRDSERTILEIPEPQFNHNSGEIAFGPDGYLYVGVGDGGKDGDVGKGHVEGGNGQDITENLLGGILRIDVDNQEGDKAYAIPEDNPLVGKEGLDEYYAWGLRNPWGMSFDSEGRLFVGDVGQELFEEINIIEKGGNYGWNIKEGRQCFDPDSKHDPPDDCPDENERGEPLIDPIIDYPQTEDNVTLGNAVIGGFVYEGERLPDLQGKYIFGDLTRTYNQPYGRLFAATPPEDDGGEWSVEALRFAGSERTMLDEYLFALGSDRNGELYLLTRGHLSPQEEGNGTVHRMVPSEENTVEWPAYGWRDATSDAYWYSFYNLDVATLYSGNGITVPFDEEQFETLPQKTKALLKGSLQRAKVKLRTKRMLNEANRKTPRPKNPNLNIAPFTTGDPHYTQQPEFAPRPDPTTLPDASTMTWDLSKSSNVVSPAALAWTQMKSVMWAKNLENHFGLLPTTSRFKFAVMAFGTLAQMGTKFALIDGNLLKNPDDEDDMRLVSEYKPATDEVVDGTPRPMQHAAMVWFLSELTSLAKGGWYGYEKPRPMVKPDKIQELTDQMAKTTINHFPPETILDMGTTRDLGLMLGAIGWYGTHWGNREMQASAREYAETLVEAVEANVATDGRVENGARNQAATQGVVGQGLVWASQIEDVDHTDTAEPVLEYMFDELWDSDAGTFADGADDGTYTITAQDAGDVTGGINTADAVFGWDHVRPIFAEYFNNTFNRGRLQRAQKNNSYNPENGYEPPMREDAGGEYGQAACYNTEVRYDRGTDEWTVTDDTFTTAQALYLANQDIWISHWGGSHYHGRGIPGRTDYPKNK